MASFHDVRTRCSCYSALCTWLINFSPLISENALFSSLSFTEFNIVPILFRFVVIDLSAGPCTYGKIETEEGSVSSRTLPRIRNMMFPGGVGAAGDHSTHDTFVGQLAALISTTVEHVVAPDVRYMYEVFCSLMRGCDIIIFLYYP